MDNFENDFIVLIKGADRVRKRPAVIFGSSDSKGCLASVMNIVDNSVNEAEKGYGNVITIKRFCDNSFEISDEGRGIPVEYNEQEGKDEWEIYFCEIYAGSKFENDSYGLNGMGLCATQYASEYMDATIYRADKKHTLHFEKGENIGGITTEENAENKKGTVIKLKPDGEVFDDINVSFEMLCEAVEEYALKNSKIRYEIEYITEEGSIKKSF